MPSRGMQTPRSGAEVNESWLQHMLTSYERRRDPTASVQVNNYRVRKGTKPGENVASEITKIWVEVELTRRKADEKEEDKKEDREGKGGTKEEEENEKVETENEDANSKEGEKEKDERVKDKEGKGKKEDEEEEKEERGNEETNSKEEEKKSEKKDNTSISNTTTTTTTTKEYNLVAKFNAGNEFDLEFTKSLNRDFNELLIYSDVITHLNTWQEQVLREKGEQGEALERYKVSVPEYVYGVCTYDEYVLVMQDVSVLGYTTQDKMEGLSLPYVLMAADRLARLHAVSHVFHKTNNFLNHYPSFCVDDRLYRFFLNYVFVMINFAVDMASQCPKFAPIVEKIRENQEGIKAKMMQLVNRDDPENRVVCLSHGDFWTNNLMYSQEATSTDGEVQSPKDLMLIDWDFLNWRNPIFDVHQLVYNCTTRSFRQQHLQDVLQRYHSTFTEVTTALGAPVPGYNYHELLKEWHRTAVVGYMQAGLFANAIVLSQRASEVFQKGSPSSGIKGAALRAFYKIMMPVILNGWFQNAMIEGIKKNFQPLHDELMSGENHVLNSRLLDTMEEAYQAGVLDV